MVQENCFGFNVCYNLSMSEVGSEGRREDRNLGGIGFSGEKAPLRKISRRGLGGPGMSGSGLLDNVLERAEEIVAVSGLSNSTTEDKKRRETWYTAHPGIDYRTGRFGSDAGDYAGTIEADTPIRVISKSKPINGIVSIQAEFKVGEEVKRAWFNMDEIRAKNPSRK